MYCIHFSQHKKYMDMLEQVQKGAMKIIRWVEHLLYRERLRELRLLNLEKRRLLGNLTATFHQWRKSKEIWRGTFYSDGTRNSGFKVNNNKFRLDNRKKFFTAGSEALEYVPCGSCRCPIHGNVQGQLGWDFESSRWHPCPWWHDMKLNDL